MSIMREPPPNTESAVPANWLRLLRAGWYLAAVASIGVFLASLPGHVVLALNGYLGTRSGAGPTSWEVAAGLLVGLLSTLVALLCLSLGVALFRQSTDNRMVLFVSFFLLFYGATMGGPLEALEAFFPGIATFSSFVLVPLTLIPMTMTLFATFPNGRFVPAWTRWIVILSLVLTPLSVIPYPFLSTQSFTPLGWLLIGGTYLVLFAVGAVMLYAQVYRFRHKSSPEERQQTKWVLYGIGLWFFSMVISTGPYFYLLSLPEGSFNPGWELMWGLVWVLSTAIIPVALSIAILRYRLYAIDLLINRTLVYSALTGALLLVFLVCVGSLQLLFRTLTGQDSQAAVALSTLVLAGLVNPLRRGIQNGIDRRFYRHKFDAEQVLISFGNTLKEEVDLDALQGKLVGVVAEAMQPAGVSLWLMPSSPSDQLKTGQR